MTGTDSGDIDLSAVPVTVPILGVREGRSRRDVGLTRAETKRRRPTNPSAMLAAREEALAARRRTYTEILDSVGGEKVRQKYNNVGHYIYYISGVNNCSQSSDSPVLIRVCTVMLLHELVV